MNTVIPNIAEINHDMPLEILQLNISQHIFSSILVDLLLAIQLWCGEISNIGQLLWSAMNNVNFELNCEWHCYRLTCI